MNLECRSERCCTRLAANAGPKKVAKNRHLGTIQQLCRAISSQRRHVSTIGKNLLSSNISSTCPPQYGELRPTSGWDRFVSLGHPSNFNGFRVLAALLHGTLVVGASQTAALNRGRPYIQQGDHHVGHWPTFYYCIIFYNTSCNLIVTFYVRSGSTIHSTRIISVSHVLRAYRHLCNTAYRLVQLS